MRSAVSQDNEQDPGRAQQRPSFEPSSDSGHDPSAGSSGYSFGSSGYEPRQDGYRAKRSADGVDGSDFNGLQSQQDPSGSQQDGYGSQPGGRGPQQSDFEAQQGGYGAQQNEYQAQQSGGYGTQASGYQPQQGGYGTPYGGYQPQGYQPVAPIYGGYGNYGPRKSKSTAALLAFFLGGLGVHDFYLGKKNLGLVHLGLLLGGFILIIVFAIAAGVSGDENSPLFAGIVPGYLLLLANNLWAFVEFIMILAKPEEDLGR